jgi:hypothetical protein
MVMPVSRGLGGRMLVRLAASEAKGRRSSPPGRSAVDWSAAFRPAEASMRGPQGAAFGVLGLGAGEHTQQEVIDLYLSMDDRLAAMKKAFESFGPAWRAKDPGGFNDFINDWTALNMRYGAARAAAKSPALALPFANPAPAFDGLVKAFKQGGALAPVQKGDFDDLDSRLRKAGGNVDYSQVRQPTALNLAGGLLALTRNFDPIGMIKGDIAPSGPLAPVVDPMKKLHDFWIKNEHLIVMAGLAASGLAVLGLIAGAIKALPFATKVVVAKAPMLAAA